MLSNEKQKGGGSGGEGGGKELGRVEGRETTIRVYYVRNIKLFSIKGGVFSSAVGTSRSNHSYRNV